ncbi:hypothetical protein IW261DRAFT_86702 [Armillaria novae-zelandiae]|uniref:Zn(2)-C6 fungal-type domain-containing protein n=1 Tax=Armillaria novae-zelandiae TaxID=153914 RepID=A0AA39USU5_9AGAR|nr:hypothetical protein IW261DRAFT_86702 [Armillaria novae-zelandiae]
MRHHSKTRTGCKTCRRRKIKCDEETPICNNCTRRKIECIWEQSDDKRPVSLAVGSHRMPPTPGQPPSEGGDMLDILGLELIHHYTSRTSFTFCRDQLRTEIYRSKLPMLAFLDGNSFLLHALLAVSALHLHSLHPTSDKYSLSAKTHYAKALTGVKAVWCGSEDHCSTADPNAVFLTYTMLIVYGHATNAPPFCQEASKDWLTVLRVLMTFGQKWPLDRDISVAFDWAFFLQELKEPTDPTVRFPESLDVLPLPLSGFPDIEEVQNPMTSAVYQESISLLRLAWSASFHPQYQTYTLMAWFGRVPVAYFNYLFERRPRALLIMAHFCAISKSVEQAWWSRKDWDPIISNIRNEVGVKWGQFMDWDVPRRSPTGANALRVDRLSISWPTNA